MAKIERNMHGDFDKLLSAINIGILEGSLSATYEGGSDFNNDKIRCAVRVYERYSMIGANRVSLNVTLIGNHENDELYVIAITSGGSQAVLFKINTLGEEAFLTCLCDVLDSCVQ